MRVYIYIYIVKDVGKLWSLMFDIVDICLNFGSTSIMHSCCQVCDACASGPFGIISGPHSNLATGVPFMLLPCYLVQNPSKSSVSQWFRDLARLLLNSSHFCTHLSHLMLLHRAEIWGRLGTAARPEASDTKSGVQSQEEGDHAKFLGLELRAELSTRNLRHLGHFGMGCAK